MIETLPSPRADSHSQPVSCFCGFTAKTHLNLIKLRASQINGCAFCIDMHSKEALKNGETQQRIFLLSAWRETDLFNEEERTLLEITEEVTLISSNHLAIFRTEWVPFCFASCSCFKKK